MINESDYCYARDLADDNDFEAAKHFSNIIYDIDFLNQYYKDAEYKSEENAIVLGPNKTSYPVDTLNSYIIDGNAAFSLAYFGDELYYYFYHVIDREQNDLGIVHFCADGYSVY